MRRTILLFAFLGSLLAFAPAAAAICDLDEQPAATLLVPYFEVGLTAAPATDTLLIFWNTSPSSVLTQVTLWTDLGIPIYTFPVGFTAYDMVSISLHDVLYLGQLPDTEPDFPVGQFGCANFLPLPDIPPTQLDGLRKALSGQASFLLLNKCAGTPSPGIARGYVTIDTVRECSIKLPGETGYFKNGGTGIATNQNVLSGITYFVDPVPAQQLSFSQPMVHLEADAKNAKTAKQPGKTAPYTFYARLVSWTAADNREPLATDFGVRFQVGWELSSTTDLFVWRDPKVKTVPFACAALPSWYRLTQRMATAFNENQDYRVLGGRLFGAAAQRVPVSVGAGPGVVIPAVIGSFGWMFLNLNHGAGAATTPRAYRNLAQSYVFGAWTAIYTAPFTGSYEATRFDSVCTPKITLRKPPS